jgi:hypothetical protein
MFQRPLFALASLLFGSALFTTLTGWMEEGIFIADFEVYQFLTIGLMWVLLGYAWSNRKESSLTRYLYFFGLPMVFIALLILGGSPPDENWFWAVLFPAAALGSMLLSLPLRSRLFLAWGAFFLIIDILKITDDYFSEGFGWPLALVIAGLALMAVGTLVVRVNKQYAVQEG